MRLQPDRARDDRGSLTVELVLLTPALFIFVLAVVAFGRISMARQQIAEAAAAGADAASVSPGPSSAASGAAHDATSELTGRTCVDPQIVTDVSHFVPGGNVTVTVSCRVALSDLSVPGIPGTTVISASSSAPIDPYRSVG